MWWALASRLAMRCAGPGRRGDRRRAAAEPAPRRGASAKCADAPWARRCQAAAVRARGAVPTIVTVTATGGPSPLPFKMCLSLVRVAVTCGRWPLPRESPGRLPPVPCAQRMARRGWRRPLPLGGCKNRTESRRGPCSTTARVFAKLGKSFFAQWVRLSHATCACFARALSICFSFSAETPR